MEKPSSSKALLDDTVPLTAVIEASQNVQSHTVSVYWEETSVQSTSQPQTSSQCHTHIYIYLYLILHHYLYSVDEHLHRDAERNFLAAVLK